MIEIINQKEEIKGREQWEEGLEKGNEIEVEPIKLFQCKKESEKKNVLY